MENVKPIYRVITLQVAIILFGMVGNCWYAHSLTGHAGASLSVMVKLFVTAMPFWFCALVMFDLIVWTLVGITSWVTRLKSGDERKLIGGINLLIIMLSTIVFFGVSNTYIGQLVT